MLDFYADQHRGIRVLRPIGELDAFTVTEFRTAIAAIASAGYLIIDLSTVPFVDSAGLGALIGGIRRTRELGGHVGLVCSRPTLLRLFHNTGIDRIAPISLSVDEAVDLLLEADLCGAGSENSVP